MTYPPDNHTPPEKTKKLRIKVEPFPGVFNKWQWVIEREHHTRRPDGRISHTWWSPVYDGGYSKLEGRSRTQEDAIARARRCAADYCDYLLRCRQYRTSKADATIIIPVTCEEEPV